MKKLTYITISFLISIISTAQNYPIQNINGVEYYVYTVEASEGARNSMYCKQTYTRQIRVSPKL